MATFFEALQSFRSSERSSGKSDDEILKDFVTIFRQKTGHNLSEFELTDQIPDFQAEAEAKAEAAMAAEDERKAQVGLGEYVYDIGTKALRGIPRTAGMVAGAVGTVIDPTSYQEGGAVQQAYADYEEILGKSQDKDFLENLNTNLLDLREATLHILATASGYSPTEKGKTEFGTGAELGGAFAGGALGGTWGMVTSPVQALYGRPADVLALILSLRGRAGRGDPIARRALQRLEDDAGKSGRGAGRSILSRIGGIEIPGLPGMRRPVKRRPVEIGATEAVELAAGREAAMRGMAEAEVTVPKKPFAKPPEGDPLTVGDLASSVAGGVAVGLPFGVTEGAWMAPLARYLWGTAEATPAGARNLAKLRRFFADPAAQAIMANEQQVRQLMREPARMRAMINREGEPLVRATKEFSREKAGGIAAMADEYRYGLDPSEQALHRPAQRMEQRIDQRFKDRMIPENTMAELKAAQKLDKKTTPIEIPIPQLSPEAATAMKQIFSHMDELGLGKSKYPVFEATVFDAMTEGSTLLMSEALRNRMVDFVIESNKLKGTQGVDAAVALQKSLLDRFEKAAPLSVESRGGAAQLVMRKPGTLRMPNNETISLSQAMEGTLGAMTDAERGAVRSEIVARVIRQAADETARVGFEEALRKETRRNTPDVMDNSLEYGTNTVAASEYGASLAAETVINGHSLNQALPRGMLPRNVAEGMRASLPELVRKAEHEVGRPLTREEHLQLRRQLDDQANRVERYEEFTDDTNRFLPEEDLKSWPQIEQELGSMPSEAAGKATNAIYVSPGFNRTVWWNTLSHRWSGPVYDFLQNFSSLIKGNLTVHNPTTHVGNYTSNVGVQSIRLGKSPMRVILETTNESRKYLDYKKGKQLSPMDMRVYKAIDYSKLFSSDLVHAELGIMKRVSASSPYGRVQQAGNLLGEPLVRAWKKYDAAMKEGYKWGDQSFKIHEASRTFREVASVIDRLDEGDYIRIRTSPSAHTTLVKQKGKMTRAGEVLTPEKLDRVIASTSVRRAFDLFVDYTQVPGLLILLRQLGPLSVASPFITWFWRVMDFPGKKGLIYRTLIDDPVFTTNNAAMTRGALGNALYLQARRMLMFNGLRETLHDNKDMMRKLIKLHGQPYGTGLFYEASNPGYFTYSRMNHTDFFAPGMHSMRVIGGMMARRLEMEEFESLDPAQKRLVQRMAAGEVATMKDVFAMAGMAGGPIVEAMMGAIHNRNRYGREYRKHEWVKQLLPVMFGQLPTKVVDVTLNGMGIWDLETELSQRKYSQNSRDPNENEDFGPWAFRTITGLGWRDAKAQNRVDWYARNVRRQIEHSLSASIKAKIKQLRKVGRNEDANLLLKDYHETLKRIRLETRIVQEEGRDLINALEHEEQIRVNPDMPGTLQAMEELE